MDWLLLAPGVFRWSITLALMAAVVVLSIAPGIEKDGDSIIIKLVVRTTPLVQKIMHFTLYAILAVLWLWSLSAVEPHALRVVLALTASVGLGAMLEWRQTRVPGRVGSLADVALNASGATAGLLITHALPGG